MAYQYVDLFEQFGITPEEPKKEEKKKEKPAAKKTDGKAGTSAKKTEEKIKLPATVYTGYREPMVLNDVAGKTEVTVKEAQDHLATLLEEYPSGITVLQKGEGNTLFLIHKDNYKVEKAELHLNKLSKMMLAGVSFDLSSLLTSEDCTVSCEDIQKLFSGIYPTYGKIGIIHSSLSNVLVPTFSFPVLNEAIEFPVKIGVFGREEMCISEEDYLAFAKKHNKLKFNSEEAEGEEQDEDTDETEVQNEGEDGRNKVGKINAKVKAEADILKLMVIDRYPDFSEHLELQWNKNDNFVVAKMIEKRKSYSAPVVEKYPTNATLSLLYTHIQLSPEMFGGKEEVEKEELREFVYKDRPEYSKERTDITYDKESNYIIMTCRGSSKGIELITDDKCAMERVKSDGYTLFDWYKDGLLFRVEKSDAFCVIAPKPMPFKGSFNLFLPKVPKEMYLIALRFFKRVYERYKTEVMIQLFWNRQDEKYFWYVPFQTIAPDSCDAERNVKLESRHVLVGDFHSHGFYNAYFSRQDDRDEKGFRIYGVLGGFDSDDTQISSRFRAGTGGCYVDLDFSDIFSEDDIMPTAKINELVDELMSAALDEKRLIVEY